MVPQVSRCIKEIQQDFAENSGFERNVIWDFLCADQGEVLKAKIRQLMPDQETGQSALEERRNLLFEQVWSQTRDSDSSDCCMVFIDETGRVYPRWESFISENELPAGIMVAPKRGIYAFDDNGNVLLEACTTPAGSVAAKVLSTADTTTAVGGFLSACVPVAAICSIPVAAPVMAVAGVVGLTAAGYSTVRSVCNLFDRSSHSQSINLTDRQARNSWLGVAAGFVGLGAHGATRAMTAVAATGREIPLVTEIVVNSMNISSIVLSGSGVANGVLDMVLRYRNDEEITALDVLQLSASLVLFTHSVSNFRMASSILAETRNGVVQSYRRELSNRQRRMFDKMAKETIRIRGEARGKIDIIRSVNDIQSKQYLNDLYKINKNLNQKNVRPSFGGAGQPVLLNGEVAVDPQVLRSSVQHNVGPDVLGQVRQPIPQSFNEQSSTPALRGERIVGGAFSSYNEKASGVPNSSTGFTEGDRASTLSSYYLTLPNGNIISFLKFGHRMLNRVMNAESFENVFIEMAHEFSKEVLEFLMNLARKFVENILDGIEEIVGMFINAESVLNRIMRHCLATYQERTLEFFEKMEHRILTAIEDYFLSWKTYNSSDPSSNCKFCGNIFPG